MKRTPRWIWISASILAAIAIGLAIFASRMEPTIRARIQQELKDRYHSDVEIQRLSISLFPRASVVGEGLVFHEKDHAGDPPLFKIRRLTAAATFSGLWGKPTHVQLVKLEGLEIHVPPKRGEHKGARHEPSPFVIDEVNADGTQLVILPKDPAKEPKVFDISKLTLRSAGPDRPMKFVATLTNPLPPGLIQSNGEFGPWEAMEPGDTPVSGKYTFNNADLSVFKGIQGILSSTGAYKGVLRRMEVDGQTDTPDFALKVAGNPVDLKTDFHAIVDGTDGDTKLEPVNAHFLKTTIVCSGAVEHLPGPPGKTVALEARVTNGRIQDILRLVARGSKPVLVGATTFQAKFALPPGKIDVIDRLDLAGAFGIGSMKFTKGEVQQKIDSLSLRAQGRPKEIGEDEATALSNLKGRFTLKTAVAEFSHLSFSMPGGELNLTGSYNLHNEELDFEGTIQTEAKASQMVTGVKSFFLRAIDPFFKKDGAGAVVPIKIAGTRSHPQFMLNLRRKK